MVLALAAAVSPTSVHTLGGNTMSESVPIDQPVRSSRRTLVWIGAVVIAFAAGFGWQYAERRQAEQQLETTRNALAEARLESALATALVEAQQGNYELARQRASEFFTDLQGATAGGVLPADMFSDIQSQRDATITMLSRGSTDAIALLQQLHAEFRSGLSRSHGSATAAPSGT